MTKIDGLAISMETISVSDGTSSTVFVGEITTLLPGGHGNDTLNSGFGNDILMGIVFSQTLRVTLFNPPSFGWEAGSELEGGAVGGHVKVFDGSGNLIVQSAELVIPPGEFRSVDFDRHALARSGEPGTGRLQARIKPFFDFKSDRLSRVLASFEIVDNSTGKTVVLAGQQCLVFYLGGIPGN